MGRVTPTLNNLKKRQLFFEHYKNGIMDARTFLEDGPGNALEDFNQIYGEMEALRMTREESNIHTLYCMWMKVSK